MEKRIAIIGAGIIGVTSACRIIETIPNAKITVYAEKFSPETTSDVSAGYWEPFCLGDGQNELILKWGKETYDRMMKVAQSENANKCGVQSMTAYVIQDKNHAHIPYWTNAVTNFKKLNLDEINNIISNNHEKKYQTGFEFLTTTCVLNRYIPYLSNELKKNGVKFVNKKFTNLSQFIDKEGDKYDYIINCTGMGAKEFVPDPNMFPTKGQVLRVKAPWLKSCVMFDSDEIIYTLPLSDLVVVGGTLEEHVYDFNTNECDDIMARCRKYLPSMKDAQVVSKHAGQRPSRKGGIRLELEIGPKAKVIHNYGHGGSGVTLSWGCASDVADIIRQDLRGNSMSKPLKAKL